tara:strand:+ start:29 stop:403 length:375 start_codon:yes stop_codon:yes gene_type:complete
VVDQVEHKTQVVVEQVVLELQQVCQYQEQQPILLLLAEVVLLQFLLIQVIMAQILYFLQSHQLVAEVVVVMVVLVVLLVVQVVELLNQVDQQEQVILPQSVHLKELLEVLVKKTEAEAVVVLLM